MENVQNITKKLEQIISRIRLRKNFLIKKAVATESAEQILRRDVPAYWLKKEIYTIEDITDRFDLPIEFVVYLTHFVAIHQDDYWRWINTWAGMVSDTIYWYDYFLTEKKYLPSNQHNPMMLLPIGGWSDKHWYFISCDKERHFGKVFEAHDSDFFDIPNIKNEEWESFLVFLDHQF